MKKYILFIMAGILAIIAAILFFMDGGTTEKPLYDENIAITAAPTVEPLETVMETTPIPTATPKPLPTSTPTPVPTSTPVPTPTEEIMETPNWENEWDNNGNTTETPNLDQMSSANGPYTVFIGDERLQALSSYARGDKNIWLCTSAANTSWFMDTACPSISEKLTSGSTIVISLGLSDLGNAGNYATIINTYAPKWKEKGCNVYFAALGPVDDSSVYTSNQEIMEFNTTVFNNTTCGFIDIYNYLQNTGFTTMDGTNYDSMTSQGIYDYIVNNI